ncbi:MAG TPA: tRNA (adenosine(37)-N6)-threonylcarbamoyltransferase complex dimerization subunit type 1 TsaB, partial [Puia sp.]|nr:tRNA (adenosine(37)-N6)-threonylcarbamoyltransferase complex dimerization subunit type 1 TsaB [Puia sp.]
ERMSDHAAWLHPAIGKLLDLAGYTLKNLDAIGLVAGPGSYTGLRVGMAAAKGFCFALEIPLITENTLRVMAEGASRMPVADKTALFCPMIDARRLEVFAAIYNFEMKELLSPAALVLDKASFQIELEISPITFFGSGSAKWKTLNTSPNAVFIDFNSDAVHLSSITEKKYGKSEFTDIIYSEPIYLKDFHTHRVK